MLQDGTWPLGGEVFLYRGFHRPEICGGKHFHDEGSRCSSNGLEVSLEPRAGEGTARIGPVEPYVLRSAEGPRKTRR